MPYKCPICDKEMKPERYMIDNILLEEYYQCKDCKYRYEYLYGIIMVYIWKFSFHVDSPGNNDRKREIYFKRQRKLARLVERIYRWLKRLKSMLS